MKDLEKALKEKLVENGASADWLDKHLEVIDYTNSKPSNKPMELLAAKNFIKQLKVEDCMYHFDDDAVDCLHESNKITTLERAQEIRQKNQKMIFLILLMK